MSDVKSDATNIGTDGLVTGIVVAMIHKGLFDEVTPPARLEQIKKSFVEIRTLFRQ